MIAPGPARPLRAVGIGLALWVGGRTAYLMNDAALPLLATAPAEARLVRGQPATALPAMKAQLSVVEAPQLATLVANPAAPAQRLPSLPSSSPTVTAVVATLLPARFAPAILADLPGARIMTATSAIADGIPGVVEAPSLESRSKWSGSVWLAARDGSAAGLASASSQLGGSQAGVRLYRQLTPALSLTGRISSALGTRQGEASAGIALRRGAFAVLAERRFALDSGGRNDWSVTAVAGVSDVRLPLGVQLDGYVQAGIVGRDGFADGALRVERTVLGSADNRIAIGVGSWGSVQPDVARLDIGPQIVAHISPAGRTMRVSAEWRQRVAGNAAPASGPVVTLGADF